MLLNCALAAYAWQAQHGRYVLRQHPASATPWRLPEVQAVRNINGVTCIVNGACLFGMMSMGDDGMEGPAKKPTRWTTYAPELVQHLARRCN